jgi:hypothetical protein
MSASLRFWPLWAVALICLLTGVWLTDDDTATAAFTASGVARHLPDNEARAMVGTWYLADGAPDALDDHCARDLRVHYRLRAVDSLGYRVECTTATGEHFTREGVTLLDRHRLQAPVSPWRVRLLSLVMPHIASVLMLEAVDHGLGMASVRLGAATESLLLSRSRYPDEDAIQAFLHDTTHLQSMANNAAAAPEIGRAHV